MNAVSQQPHVFTTALFGKPNAGKSTLFNALTGKHQTIGNWPGVTIEKKEGTFTYQDTVYKVTDLPGIIQLEPQSDDERIALKYLIEDKPDLIVAVLDASNMQRCLYLTLQLLELKKPTLIALNMMDIAKRNHLQIDLATLEKTLGCPVVPLSGLEQPSAFRLKQAIARALENPPIPNFFLPYPPAVEKQLAHLDPDRAAALLRLTTMDLDEKDQKEVLEETGHSAATLIAQCRYDFINALVAKVVTQKEKPKADWSDKIDSIVLNRYLSVPIFFGIMYLLFTVVQTIGSNFVDFFDATAGIVFVEYPAHLFDMTGMPDWLKNFLVYGIGSGIQAICGFVPVVFLMFFCLGLLEQSGYLARSAFVMDRLLQMLGLPGKSFIPLILGFGCTTTAVMATRGLSRWTDKLLTAYMAPLMSCSARMPVYAVFCAAFFGAKSGLIIFSLYVLGIVLAILTGLLFGKTVFRSAQSAFLMELPRYHWPKPSMVLQQAVRRLHGFFWKAGRILVMVMAVIGTLNTLTPQFKVTQRESESILSHIGRGITPVFSSFGVEKDNWPASVALVIGLFAKESVVSSMGSLYLQDQQLDEEAGADEFSWSAPWLDAFTDLRDGLIAVFTGASEEIDTPLAVALREKFTQGPWQVYAYLVFVLLYVPCVGAMAATIHEIGLPASMLLMVYLLAGPWAIATLFYQLAVAHQPGFILAAAGTLLGIALALHLLAKWSEQQGGVNPWVKG